MNQISTNTPCSNGGAHSLCFYPQTEYLTSGWIKARTASHRLCIFLDNSVGNEYGGCTGGWQQSTSINSLAPTRKKSAAGYAYNGAALQWSHALVYW
jgi:hypothetical protein